MRPRAPAKGLRLARIGIPMIGLAYPLLIQPLMTYDPGAADAGLDLAVNARVAESNLANQAFWLLLLGIGLVVYWKTLKQVGAAVRQPAGFLVVLFLAFALASVTWSPVPGIGLRRWGLQTIVVCCAVFGTYLAADSRTIARGMAWLFALVAFVNVPLVLLLSIGRLGGSLGLYSNKNILGLVMAMALIVICYGLIVARSAAERTILLLGGAASLVCLWRSDSETSLALGPLCLLLTGVALGVSRLLRVGIGTVVAVGILFGICAVLAYGVSGGSGEELLQFAFGDPTFSGRTEIWSYVANSIAERPLTGIGYGSYWGTGQNSLVMETAPGFIVGLLQAHNGYLDVMLEGGGVGLVILLMILIALLSLVGRRDPSFSGSLRFLILAIALFAILHNGMESSWFRGFSPVWYCFLMVIGLALRPATRVLRIAPSNRLAKLIGGRP